MKAYFIGGEIGSLAGAAFLIRDAAILARDITVYDALPLFGESLDGAQLSNGAYSLRGGRMPTTGHYVKRTVYNQYDAIVRPTGSSGTACSSCTIRA